MLTDLIALAGLGLGHVIFDTASDEVYFDPRLTYPLEARRQLGYHFWYLPDDEFEAALHASGLEDWAVA